MLRQAKTDGQSLRRLGTHDALVQGPSRTIRNVSGHAQYRRLLQVRSAPADLQVRHSTRPQTDDSPNDKVSADCPTAGRTSGGVRRRRLARIMGGAGCTPVQFHSALDRQMRLRRAVEDVEPPAGYQCGRSRAVAALDWI